MPRVFRPTVQRSWRSPCAWLVVFALAWGILAPRLAQALHPTDGRWIEVCTGLGMKRVQVDATFAPGVSDDDTATATADCPHCRLQAGLALPPADSGLAQRVTLPHITPARRAAPSQILAPPWRPAQPRGPPSTTPV